MNKYMTLVASCAIVATMAVFARADADVGKAAMDVSQISGMLAEIDDGEKPTFLKQVVEAATKLPIDPEKRPDQIASVISAALDAMPSEQMPELLTALVCKVPFSLLPATVEALIPGMRTRTAAMSDEEFHDSLTRAVQAVQKQGLDDDDADIYTAFIITLFAKLPAVADNQPIIEQALTAVPEANRNAIGSMVTAAIAGDYESIFGPEGADEVIYAMNKDSDDLSRSEKDDTGDAFQKPDVTVFVDVGLERPVIIEEDDGGKHAGPGGGGGHKKPPVLPPYKGQGSF